MILIAETPRLILRQFIDQDFAAIAAILADPIGMQHIGPGTPNTAEQSRQWLNKSLQNNRYDWSAETLERVPQLLRAPQRNAHFSMWAVIDRETNALIGRSGLLAWNLDGHLEVEVGYHLARPFWGCGLATEAARAVRDYGFDRLGFDRLISIIKPENVASQRVAVKNGMHHERDAMVKEWPVMAFALTRGERDAVASEPVRA
jgi:ribosomal-protein-alanine N-acetyltransferase